MSIINFKFVIWFVKYFAFFEYLIIHEIDHFVDFLCHFFIIFNKNIWCFIILDCISFFLDITFFNNETWKTLCIRHRLNRFNRYAWELIFFIILMIWNESKNFHFNFLFRFVRMFLSFNQIQFFNLYCLKLRLLSI